MQFDICIIQATKNSAKRRPCQGEYQVNEKNPTTELSIPVVEE